MAEQQLFHFTLQETRELAEYQATGYRYVHACGMEVCFVENQDPEQFFSFVFRTIPQDDSGVAHILEHSTLSGSSRYQVHDPFIMLDKASVNTYMNAMTYPDKTVYLASSPLAKDFDNLFDVYADAVFAPLLRKETFEQEGVRLVPDGKGAHWEGVVFNEMRGASADPDSILVRGTAATLFPGTCYARQSGGDPRAIVDLTWERYRAWYRSWYHPANCRLLVYGKNDIPSILRKLDERYLAGRPAGSPVAEPEACTAWKADARATFPAPKEDSGKENDASVVLAWDVGDASDSTELTALNTLVDLLLDDPSCPLYRKLLDSGLADDISPESGMIADFQDLVFLVGFKGIKPGREQEAREVILQSLRDICAEGIGDRAIEASLRRARFKLQEIPGGVPQGLRILSRCIHGWMAGKGPFATMQVRAAMDAVEARLHEDPRYFEHWMERHLLDNPHRALVGVVPDKGYLAGVQAVLDRKAAERLGPETKGENEAFTAFENTPDTPEEIAALPHLRLADLPKDIVESGYTERTVASRPVLWKRRFTDGIDYLTLAIDVADLDEDRFRCLTLLSRLLGMSDVASMPARDVSLAIKRLFGVFNVSVDAASDVEDGTPRAWFFLQMGFLSADRNEALDFLFRLLSSSKVDDPRSIRIALNDLKGDFTDSLVYNATAFATQYAESLCTEAAGDMEALGGVTQWRWLASLAPDGFGRLGELLDSTLAILRQRDRVRAVATSGDEGLLDAFRSFLELLPEGRTEEEGRKRMLVRDGAHLLQGFPIPQSVAYQTQVVYSRGTKDPVQVAQTLLGQMMATGDLWSAVRMKGGAYGVDARTDLVERLFVFSTYRDPQVGASFAVYRDTLARYAAGACTEAELEQAKLSYVGMELKPKGPKEEASFASRHWLYGYDAGLRRKRRLWLLDVTPAQVAEGATALLASMDRCDVKVVFTGSDRLKAELPEAEIQTLPL